MSASAYTLWLVINYYYQNAPQSKRTDPLRPACHSGLLAVQGPRPASRS